MSSSLPLSFNHHLFRIPKPHSNRNNFSPFSLLPRPYNSHICFSSPPSNDSDYRREEARWLREEQRWLREEQRWLRVESRWNDERESLLREIQTLELRIQQLERQNSLQGASVPETVSNVSKLLQLLMEGELAKKVNQIADTGSSAVPMLEAVAAEERVEMEEKVVVKEVVRTSEGQGNKRKPLRRGSEGDEVRVMQEALQKLGFYSGEEDMEFSSFSSGTERAVRTWQATLGAPEDGIMTSELLERLYMEKQVGSSGSMSNSDRKGNGVTSPSKADANGAAVASITEISKIQERVLKEEAVEQVEVSQHRVFLLGENRWEEPSRLAGSKKNVAAKTCLSCRGEGRLLCTECDGTGEPNIEPQFLEWIDEGTKCPYCEGKGYTLCDVCVKGRQ